MDARKKIRRKLLAAHRSARSWRMVAKALLSTKHPLLAHIIPIRRCNLACAYCNEYDDFSKPVPLDEMLRRVDRLASFGTSIITISGGEPLLHPELDDIIRRIRHHGMIAGMITNGYLLTRGSHRRASTPPVSNSCKSASTTRSPTKSRRRA